jgi:hypothetical protein
MIKSNQCIEGENSMEKKPSKEVLAILNSVKEKLEDLYKKYHDMYENAKDEATEKKAFDKGNTIVSEHKAVVDYLKRYHALFSALYTPEYNGNSDVINQINNLETEILNKYRDKIPTKPAAAPAQDKPAPAPALEKGKKYSVTDTKKSEKGKDRFLGIASTIGALLLSSLALGSLSAINVSSFFDALISIPLYGGIATVSGWGVVATGKYAIQKFKEANAKSKSKSQ